MIHSKYTKEAFIHLLNEGFFDSNERIKGVINTHSSEQLNWKPDPGTWSVLEVVAHLVETTSSYMPKLDKAVNQPNTKPESQVEIGFMGKLLAKGSAPNAGKKRMKTPKVFLPQQTDLSKEELEKAWTNSQEYLMSLCKTLDQFNLSKTKLKSPASGFIKLNVAGAMLTLMVHQKRHLEQIDRLLQHPNFPA